VPSRTIVPHRVVDDVAHGLLEERDVRAREHRMLRDRGIDRHVVLLRDRPMAPDVIVESVATRGEPKTRNCAISPSFRKSQVLAG
jgi:hypothetical protein